MVAKCLFCSSKYVQHVILLFMDKIDCYTFISLLSHVLHLPPSSLSPPSAGTLDYVTEVERVDETDDNIVLRQTIKLMLELILFLLYITDTYFSLLFIHCLVIFMYQYSIVSFAY